jgi:sortase A
MARDRRRAEDLSVEELESLLARKRVEARRDRLDKYRRTGRAMSLSGEAAESPDPGSHLEPDLETVDEDSAAERTPGKPGGGLLNRGLLLVEIAAVGGLVFVLLSGFGALRQLNRDVAEALGVPTAQATPLITAVVLPSGHTPPSSPGGAQPNDAEIPANLRPMVQSLTSVPIPTVGPGQARSMNLPSIWQAPAPVVQGDGWEQLKRGVGQHIGSANPGQAGNLVLSAHNDIFGELFRELDQLKPGDKIVVSSATRDYVYRVTGMRIVEPTDVDVMVSTSRPTITLISCYPYLVDDQRIVVFGELSDE